MGLSNVVVGVLQNRGLKGGFGAKDFRDRPPIV